MGWDVSATGFRLVLSADLPDVVERYLGDDVNGFLAEHDLTVDDIDAWVSPPGRPEGPRGHQRRPSSCDDDALELTWRSLAEIGNLSSASVLHVLRDTMRQAAAERDPGVMMAMGPGFCAELVLLRWMS